MAAGAGTFGVAAASTAITAAEWATTLTDQKRPGMPLKPVGLAGIVSDAQALQGGF